MFKTNSNDESFVHLASYLINSFGHYKVWSYNNTCQSSVEVASLASLFLLTCKYKIYTNRKIFKVAMISEIDSIIEKTTDFFIDNQHGDGGWSITNNTIHSDWSTSRACLFLRYFSELAKTNDYLINKSISKAIYFLAASRYEKLYPTSALRLLLLIGSGESSLRYGRGWPWDLNCYHWIEPTTYNLLALQLPKNNLNGYFHKIIKQANRYILDNSCYDGGWNFGNSEVLNTKLRSITSVTGEVLLALQKLDYHPKVKLALNYFFDNVNEDSTVTEIALAQIINDIYKHNQKNWVSLLTTKQNTDGSFGLNNYVASLCGLSLLSTLGCNVFKMG